VWVTLRRAALGLAVALVALVPGVLLAGDAMRRTPVVEAVEKVSPAVVNIWTEQAVESPAGPFGTLNDPFFEEFFRDFVEPRRFTRTSLGSGVIIRPDGYVLTNQHVVLKANRIHVALVSGREFEATLVGAESDSDLAVLRIKAPGDLPHVELGTSDDLMIGETVIAIGNPFGLSHTVTTGVVSAVGRTLQQGDQTYYDFIQTDASINPGNSGGPLLNIRGALVGVNTAIYQKAQGIGFAVPVDRARRIVSDLIAYGAVRLPWVGAIVQELTPDIAAHFGAGGARGVVVRDLEAESPAAAAGVGRGDVITAVNGRPVQSRYEFEQRVRDQPVDGEIRLTVTRDGTERTLTVRAREYPLDRADTLAWDLLGLRVDAQRSGLVVRAVRAGSSAARIGVERGDYVVGLGGVALDDVAAFRKKMVEVRLAQSVLLSVRRGGYVYNVPVPLRRPRS
jgi:serine protease Do